MEDHTIVVNFQLPYIKLRDNITYSKAEFTIGTAYLMSHLNVLSRSILSECVMLPMHVYIWRKEYCMQNPTFKYLIYVNTFSRIDCSVLAVIQSQINWVLRLRHLVGHCCCQVQDFFLFEVTRLAVLYYILDINVMGLISQAKLLVFTCDSKHKDLV